MTGPRPASLAWKLVFFVPLGLAVALQFMSARQADLHAGVKLSIIGNIFLSASLIAQAVFLLRTSTRWGVVMLIFASVVLGFGLHVLMRAI